MLDRAEDLRRALVGAEGEDPGHRQVGEAHGQREQRRGGPAVSPLQVVERSSANADRSSSGCEPSKSAVISGASSTTPAPGSAAPAPTRNASRPATRTASAKRRVLPMPGSPSTSTTAPIPERTRSS